MMVLGLIILVPTWCSLVYLKSLANGSAFIIYLLFLIWAADSGAYFIGRKWGKRKLASHVSPGKTWEGTIAGIISGLFVTMAFILFTENIVNNEILFILISILVIVMSVIGDLMESIVKRNANIKDSGHLLPGHGGILDRIDSLTAAAPVFTFGLIVTGMYQ